MIGYIAAAGALLGGLQSYLSSKSTHKRINDVKRMLLEEQIGIGEKKARLDKISDLYNTEMQDANNQSAIDIALQGIRNTSNFLAATRGKMLGERARMLVDAENKIDDYNRQIRLQANQLELNKPDSPLTSALGGAIFGGIAGAQLGLAIDEFKNKPDSTNIAQPGSAVNNTNTVQSNSLVNNRNIAQPSIPVNNTNTVQSNNVVNNTNTVKNKYNSFDPSLFVSGFPFLLPSLFGSNPYNILTLNDFLNYKGYNNGRQ